MKSFLYTNSMECCYKCCVREFHQVPGINPPIDSLYEEIDIDTLCDSTKSNFESLFSIQLKKIFNSSNISSASRASFLPNIFFFLSSPLKFKEKSNNKLCVISLFIFLFISLFRILDCQSFLFSHLHVSKSSRGIL